MENKVLPIAEIFESIQGEGQWVGTPMLFIRLAGCNVGKPAKALKVEGPFPLLHTGREAMACTTFDGRIFPCDTDYSLKEKLHIDNILHRLKEDGMRHVCVTGGEPFLHESLLEELFYELASRDITMHVETSGTIASRSWPEVGMCPGYWVTCAPKLSALSDMINRADELKLLVDEHFDEFKLTPEMLNHPNVFLCPINSVGIKDGQNIDNVKRCYDLLLTKFPYWRMSVQQHKNFGWR
jgi:7-carboxy-7-deazaguanine synthase